MIIDGINIIEELKKYKNDNIIILGHKFVDVDSVISGYLIEKCLSKYGYKVCFCIEDEEISKETLDILKEYNFDANMYKREYEDNENNKYFLADHKDRELKGEIIGIIDHHPTCKEYSIKLYFNKAISSTTLYLCKGNENEFDSEDIELAILAAMLDTASFNSTKAREEDKLWCIEKCKEYNLDYNKLYKLGLYFTPLDDLQKCSLNGLKKYNYENKKVESSYVHIDGFEGNEDKIRGIIDILKKYVKEKELDVFAFIVHDMKVLKTTVYKIYDDKVKVDYYDKYTSRGNDIMPLIEKEILKWKN